MAAFVASPCAYLSMKLATVVSSKPANLHLHDVRTTAIFGHCLWVTTRNFVRFILLSANVSGFVHFQFIEIYYLNIDKL